MIAGFLSPRQEATMRSVFGRKTDALQYAKGIAFAILVCIVFWGGVFLAFWWAL